ncbi:TPA: hypothetical protein DCZ36_01220, partial [Candidatus Gracilibacteria bacterium]|nr:hypothetical protein [Candidatus Gracilibacteria bacterium]
MSNRLLSLLILTLIFAGLFGVYYYFFVANTGSVSFIINGSGSTSITLTSEFGSNSLYEGCERSCLFADIPAVNYTVSAKREGYIPFTKNFTLHGREMKKVMIMMKKEVILTEQKRKKEDTIATLKLQKSIQDTLETNTGGIVLGYRTNGLYYALSDDVDWSILMKKEGEEARELFKIPKGILIPESLDIYEGYIALKKGENMSFYSLASGTAMHFVFDGTILSIKDTLDDDTKIITSDAGVFMYSVSEKTARANPLYDDIIQLASGEIVALVKKTSKTKQSLLSITDTDNDSVFLIGRDTRERSLLFQTPKNGKLLRY